VLTWTGVAAWAGLFIVPLGALYLLPRDAASAALPPLAIDWFGTGLHSVLLSAGIAALAVVLGYLPGRLLGASLASRGPRGAAPLPRVDSRTAGRAEAARPSADVGPWHRGMATPCMGGTPMLHMGKMPMPHAGGTPVPHMGKTPMPRAGETPVPLRRAAGLLLLLVPLLLPSYVLFYGWEMLLSPGTALGQYVSSRRELAQWAAQITSAGVVLLWHWPVAALILTQGWRNLDPSTMEIARLDAGGARRLVRVELPLLAGPIALAFGTCFVLSLSEYTTFHLAGINTIGTELDGLFRMGGDEHTVARSSWPLLPPAAAIAIALWRSASKPSPASEWGGEGPSAPASGHRKRRAEWLVLAGLLAVSCAVPIGLMVLSLREPSRIRQFFRLHEHELVWSALVAGAAGVISLWIARSAVALGNPRSGGNARSAPPLRLRGVLSACMQVTILLTMFLPPSLLGVSLLKLMTGLHLPPAIRESWLAVSAGLTLRYAGLAGLVLWFARRSESRELDDLAAIDGASPARAWWHVHLPRHWPLPAAAGLMILLFGMTEVPATMILLPAGLPSFSQWLLNQMHYVRDQDVVIACLALVGAYLMLAGAAAAILRVAGAAAYGKVQTDLVTPAEAPSSKHEIPNKHQ
jgi:iron(III) transport system permease protein